MARPETNLTQKMERPTVANCRRLHFLEISCRMMRRRRPYYTREFFNFANLICLQVKDARLPLEASNFTALGPPGI